jgi:tetratricopeptide (TPR) repeat protein
MIPIKAGILSVQLLLGFCISGFSQCKDTSISASGEVVERAVLFDDAYKAKNFTEAKGSLNWLLLHAPKLNTNLYIKAVDTYDALATVAKNPEQRKIYLDSVMIVYDLRIKNCGEEPNVTNRKAISFFNYYYNSPTKSKEILTLMDRAIDLSQKQILDGIAENYMQAVRIAAGQKSLTSDEILERYETITEIIEEKTKKAQTDGKSTDRYKKMQEDNILILSTLVDINCEFVRIKLAPKFRENPADLALAKRIFNFMLKGKCTDDPLWLEAAETLHAAEKDFGLAKILGLRYLSLKDNEKAATLFAEALQLAPTSSDKAEIIGLQGHVEQLKGDHSKARELYLKAIVLDPTKKELYARIGDLYLNSFEMCKRGKSHAEDRFIFLAAYDMYQKAGETQRMADVKASFPSREEVHEMNYEPGQKIVVSCWINEETTIRTRN